jgi:hypothetical protein
MDSERASSIVENYSSQTNKNKIKMVMITTGVVVGWAKSFALLVLRGHRA